MKTNDYKVITELNKKPTILIDMDETMNNLNEKWVELYNKKYNDNLSHKNISNWVLDSFFVKCKNRNEFLDLLETPGLFSKMVTPIKNSIKVTEILSYFYELYIVTSCTHPSIIIEKFEWVEKYFPHIHNSDIITCKNKGLIIGDYMIDDYVENLNSFKGKNKILINQPYNINIELPLNYVRVNSWDDILMYFASINKDVMDYLIDNDIITTDEKYIEKIDLNNLVGIREMLNMNFNIQK